MAGHDGSFSLDDSIIIESLTMGVTYKFRVRAHNDFGWGDYSFSSSFETFDYPDTVTGV